MGGDRVAVGGIGATRSPTTHQPQHPSYNAIRMDRSGRLRYHRHSSLDLHCLDLIAEYTLACTTIDLSASGPNILLTCSGNSLKRRITK